MTAGDVPPQPKASKNLRRDTEFEVALGARIRTARRAAGMSQTALGDAVGISYQQLAKYEKGTDRVAASTLRAIAAALGVGPGMFFGDDVPVPFGSHKQARRAHRLGQRSAMLSDPAIVRELLGLVDALVKSNALPATGEPT